ncbi:MAG: hypothetical protein SXQ77_01230 [Halobacteria archaeon]|nr:hypothetical protein [Halobacteria archaeon]
MLHHSYVINHNPLAINFTELETIDSYHMLMFLFADMDIMYSTGFDKSDLSELRKIVFKGQKMARIGNWLSTWEREVDECDFSSGVFIYAVEQGVISESEVMEMIENPSQELKEEVKKKIRESNVEQGLCQRWQYYHDMINSKDYDVSSFDVTNFLEGMETFLKYHLASKGLK